MLLCVTVVEVTSPISAIAKTASLTLSLSLSLSDLHSFTFILSASALSLLSHSATKIYQLPTSCHLHMSRMETQHSFGLLGEVMWQWLNCYCMNMQMSASVMRCVLQSVFAHDVDCQCMTFWGLVAREGVSVLTLVFMCAYYPTSEYAKTRFGFWFVCSVDVGGIMKSHALWYVLLYCYYTLFSSEQMAIGA